MKIKFNDVMTKGDWAKMTILVVISVICWVWVWVEWQKPVISPEWEAQINADIIK